MKAPRNWDAQVSWDASAPVRTESEYLTSAAKNAAAGREFRDSFRFNGGPDRAPQWVTVRLGDCVSVYVAPDASEQPNSDPDLGNEYCRVLELWEDKKGEDAGSMAMLVRWFFLPRHLPSDCKERTRTRKGPGRKQCFEQCDAGAHADINPVASVRKVCKVLCTWDDRRNPQPPDIQTIPLGTYDLWFESGWDAREGRVVPLDQCVDSKDKRYPCLKSSEICHKLPAAQQAAAPPPATEPRPEEPKPTIKKRKSSEEQASDKRPRMESESPPDVGQPTGVRVPHPQKQKAPDEPARGKEKAARVEVPAPRAVPVEPTKHPLPKPTDVAAIGAEKTAALAQPVQSKPFNTRIPKRPADASLSPEAGSPPQASVPKAANVVPAAGPAAVGRAPPRGEAMATLAQWQQTSRQGQAPPAVLRVDGVPPAMVPGEWQAALKAARVVHKSTALGGWTLPDGTWRGNGSAYVLCDRASAQQTLTQLSGAVLKVSGVPGVRPLVCEQCDLHRLIPPNPPPPLPGHMSTAAPDMNSTRAARIGAGEVVPHFVHATTLEVALSLPWRVLSVQHKVAGELLAEKQAAELVDVLAKT